MSGRATAALAGLALLQSTVCCSADARGADAAEPTNRVDFYVEQSRHIANDWVQAVVGVTEEDVDAGALAGRVNRTMAWALETARSRQGIEVQTAAYRTSPVWEKGVLRRWRADHDLVIEGADAEAVSELIGELQSRMVLRSLGFSVSPDARRRVEDELIAAALAAFRARAELVRKSLEKSGYEIVRIALNTGGVAPMRRVFAEATMAMERSAPPPALEGGRTELTVRARGTIELF